MNVKEFNGAKKQLATKTMVVGEADNTCSTQGRIFKSGREGKNAMVFLPGLKEPQALLVRDALSRRALAGMLVISIVQATIVKRLDEALYG